MKCKHWLEVYGNRRPHIVEFEFDFSMGRSAPKTSDHDSPGFSDPGDPWYALIERAWMLRPGQEQHEPVRRELPAAMVKRFREDTYLEEQLWNATIKSFPRE